MLFPSNTRDIQMLNCHHFMTTFNLRLVPPLNLTTESFNCPELNPTTPNPFLVSFNKNPNLSKGMCLLSIVRRHVVIIWWVLPCCASLMAQLVKNPACNAGDPGSIPGWGRSLEKEMATHSSILAWRIPWTEEAGGLQSMGLQRVGHDLSTKPPPLLCWPKKLDLLHYRFISRGLWLVKL